ncbi:MAG TPA: LysM peptidoglycan-binding domain-containing protein [Candidatus Limosilactobacillus merdigallinarum]|uniref:LysM peptidoglycan-binding domain-containing protein n=1 Tax=Candidatus Limosilactobacillus merdigallinarum TaxID=2838652 RepID=A0A9D2AKX1_9LACO|nr:LysM peptidoglycan-binding domain-containing protein [Candidatus Limosilactobacillus merdigallinarum]
MSKKNFVKLSATLGATVLGISAATAVANADTIYTVKEGDTLYSISQKFNNDGSLVNTLAIQNHIKDINMIHVGDKLVIKSNGQIKPATKQDVKNNQNQSKTAQPSNNTNTSSTSKLSASDQAAKEWIAQRESSGSYTAQNGRYYGRYQLDLSYLNGDLSPENQDRVADQYVASRYGSWTAAQAHWMANGWY